MSRALLLSSFVVAWLAAPLLTAAEAHPGFELIQQNCLACHAEAQMSGLDLRYDLGEGHPLLGRRMPDLDLVTAEGTCRMFTLLHDASPVLLDLGGVGDTGHPRGLGGLDVTPWSDRVRIVRA